MAALHLSDLSSTNMSVRHKRSISYLFQSRHDKSILLFLHVTYMTCCRVRMNERNRQTTVVPETTSHLTGTVYRIRGKDRANRKVLRRALKTGSEGAEVTR